MKTDNFANRLSQALSVKGLKAADLSRMTSVSEGTISCYLNGRYEAKQQRVRLFAEALRVNPAWLMGYDVPMDSTPPAILSDPSPASAPATPQDPLQEVLDQLNQEGREKVLEYAQALVALGTYKKSGPLVLDQKDA